MQKSKAVYLRDNIEIVKRIRSLPFAALDTSDELEGADVDHKPCDAAQAERCVTEINWRNKKRTLLIRPDFQQLTSE